MSLDNQGRHGTGKQDSEGIARRVVATCAAGKYVAITNHNLVNTERFRNNVTLVPWSKEEQKAGA